MTGKLTDRQRAEMRRLHYEEGWGYRRLSKRFGVAVSSAARTVNELARQQQTRRAKRHDERKAAELAELRVQVARLTPIRCSPGAVSAMCSIRRAG